MTVTLSDRLYWNARGYGKRIRLHKTTVLAVATLVCLAVPFILPVWLVPILAKFLKGDLFINVPEFVWRWFA